MEEEHFQSIASIGGHQGSTWRGPCIAEARCEEVISQAIANTADDVNVPIFSLSILTSFNSTSSLIPHLSSHAKETHSFNRNRL